MTSHERHSVSNLRLLLWLLFLLFFVYYFSAFRCNVLSLLIQEPSNKGSCGTQLSPLNHSKTNMKCLLRCIIRWAMKAWTKRVAPVYFDNAPGNSESGYKTLIGILRRNWQHTVNTLNPLYAKIFRRNKNIHLHFMSLLHIDMTQVIGILPQVRLGLTHST